jgi:hypothetical protein
MKLPEDLLFKIDDDVHEPIYQLSPYKIDKLLLKNNEHYKWKSH